MEKYCKTRSRFLQKKINIFSVKSTFSLKNLLIKLISRIFLSVIAFFNTFLHCHCVVEIEFDFTEKFVKTSFATFLEVVFTKKPNRIELCYFVHTYISMVLNGKFRNIEFPKKMMCNFFYRSNEIPIFHRSCTH